MPKYTADKVIEAIHHYNGNIAAVARAFKTNRQQIYDYMERHPTVKAAREEARESMLDNAESVLYRKVLSGEDTTALIFFLKTQGARRGYTERVDFHDSRGADAIKELVGAIRKTATEPDDEL